MENLRYISRINTEARNYKKKADEKVFSNTRV